MPHAAVARLVGLAMFMGAAAAAGLTFRDGQATWYPSIYQGSCGFFANVPKFVGEPQRGQGGQHAPLPWGASRA